MISYSNKSVFNVSENSGSDPRKAQNGIFDSVQPLSCSPSQSEPGPGLWTCGPACQRIPCIWTFIWIGWLSASRFWNRLLVSTNGLVCELSHCCQASVPCCYQPWLLTIHLWWLFSFSAQTANLQCSTLTASHKLLVLPLLTSATNLLKQVQLVQM